MTNGNRLLQTTSVVPARVMLYQPTQRPTFRSGKWVETSWGRCKVEGRMGQRHADVLEISQYCAELMRKEDGGTIRLLVDPAKVRRMMSDDLYSEQQLWKLLKDMRESTIEIDTPAIRLMGGVIESAAKAKHRTVRNPFATRFAPTPSPPALHGDQRKKRTGEVVATARDRKLWVIRLGLGWTELMRLDLPLYYDPAPIARLQFGISQAVVRHVLTHSHAPNRGWTVDGLISAVAGELRGQKRRDARRNLHADAARIAAIGIVVEGDRVYRAGIGLDGRSVGQPPGSVGQPPGSVGQPPGGVGQPPGETASLQDLQGPSGP